LTGLAQTGPQITGASTATTTPPPSSNQSPPHLHDAWCALWQQYMAAGLGGEGESGQIATGRGQNQPKHEALLANPHH